jgi:hypothetical protein
MKHLIDRASLALILLAPVPGIWAADTTRYDLELEIGATWQAKNKVQIPNDNQGDRFELTDIADSGPWASARINALWNVSGRHDVRLVLAPFSYEERGSFDQDVRFAGETIRQGSPVSAKYTFNSWRLGYRYQYYDAKGWKLWVGGTAKVRDAEIELRQGDTDASDDDLGVLPLLYLAGEYRFNERWRFQFDFDGLAGGPGRAIDLSLKLGYEVNDRWRVSAGYRGLEGGADTDDVYNFAWFNTGLISAQYSF